MKSEFTKTTLCRYELAADGRWRCAVCGDMARPSARPPKRACGPRGQLREVFQLPPAACRHRGERLRAIECQSCCGRTRVKVFACDVHGECTLGKPLDAGACCATCQDYAPPCDAK